MSSKYLKNYKVPEGFEEVIENLTKEVLKNQPLDVLDFSVEYFRCLQEGLIFDYKKKGKRLPYKFKPSIPTLTKFNYSFSLTQENKYEPNSSNGMKQNLYCKTTPGFNPQDKAKENEKKETLLKSNSKKEQFGIKLNFINLDIKEQILHELKKKNNEEIEQYMTTVYSFNKQFTDLVIKIQKIINSFYQTKYKGSIFNSVIQEYNEINKQISSFQDLYKFTTTFASLTLKQAIDSFKSFEFYPQMLICYFIQLTSLVEDNSSLLPFLDEFCYFLLGPSLKDLINEPVKNIKNYPWISFFKTSIIYLQPEVYKLYRMTNMISNDCSYFYYTKFPIRIRELFKNLYMALSFDLPNRQKQKEIEIYERWYYNTSLEQLNVKLISGKNVYTDEECETIANKIQIASNKIWQLLTGILNMPVEAMDEFIWRYKQFNSLEQEIVVHFLQLKDEYAEIEKKFSVIPKSSEEITILSTIKQLFDYYKIKGNDELENTIIDYQFRVIENKLNQPLKELLSGKETNDESILDKLNKMDYTQREILYHLLQTSFDNKLKNSIIEKIKIVQAHSSIDNYFQRVNFLNEYFSRDSVEYECFIEELNQWKQLFPSNLKKTVEIERKQQLCEFKKLNRKDQKFIIKMFKLTQLINEEEDQELSQLIKEAENISVDYLS